MQQEMFPLQLQLMCMRCLLMGGPPCCRTMQAAAAGLACRAAGAHAPPGCGCRASWWPALHRGELAHCNKCGRIPFQPGCNRQGRGCWASWWPALWGVAKSSSRVVGSQLALTCHCKLNWPAIAGWAPIVQGPLPLRCLTDLLRVLSGWPLLTTCSQAHATRDMCSCAHLWRHT